MGFLNYIFCTTSALILSLSPKTISEQRFYKIYIICPFILYQSAPLDLILLFNSLSAVFVSPLYYIANTRRTFITFLHYMGLLEGGNVVSNFINYCRLNMVYTHAHTLIFPIRLNTEFFMRVKIFATFLVSIANFLPRKQIGNYI